MLPQLLRKKRTVNLLKMYNGMNYYVPVQDETSSYKK